MDRIRGSSGETCGASTLISVLGESKARQLDVIKVPDTDINDQLSILLGFLREHHLYCLYCGCAYDNSAQMDEGCPGAAEDLH